MPLPLASVAAGAACTYGQYLNWLGSPTTGLGWLACFLLHCRYGPNDGFFLI
jgi:uncharacterized membrane protein